MEQPQPLVGAAVGAPPGATPLPHRRRRRGHPRHRRTVSAPAGTVGGRAAHDHGVGGAAAATATTTAAAAAAAAASTPGGGNAVAAVAPPFAPFSQRAVSDRGGGSSGSRGGADPRTTCARPPLPAAAAARVARDVSQLRGEAPPFVEVAWDEAAAASRVWALVVGAFGTPYAGGLFRLVVDVPPDYPHTHPTVRLAPAPADAPPPRRGGGHPALPRRPGAWVDHPVLAASRWSPVESLQGVLLSVQALLSAPPEHPELGVPPPRAGGGGGDHGMDDDAEVDADNDNSNGNGGTVGRGRRAGGGGGRERQLVMSAGVAGLIASARGAAEWARSVELRAAGAGEAAAAAPAGGRGRNPPSTAGATGRMGATQAGPAAAPVDMLCPSTPVPGRSAGAVAVGRPPVATAGAARAAAIRGAPPGGGGAIVATVHGDGARGSTAGAAARAGAGVTGLTADAAATRACLWSAVVDAVAPAALRASPVAAATVRAFLLFYDTYVAAVAAAAAAAEGSAAAEEGGSPLAGRRRPPHDAASPPPSEGWPALAAALAAAHTRLAAAVSCGGWSYGPPPRAPVERAVVAARLRAEAAALAGNPPRGVVSAAPRDATNPFIWDAVVAVGGVDGGGGGGDVDDGGHLIGKVVCVSLEVAAAADHPATAPAVRLAAGTGLRHPNVSWPGGVPAVGACGGSPGGSVGEVLAGVARLLAAPDPRWPVDADAAAAYRGAPAAFWSSFRRLCGGEALGAVP